MHLRPRVCLDYEAVIAQVTLLRVVREQEVLKPIWESPRGGLAVDRGHLNTIQ